MIARNERELPILYDREHLRCFIGDLHIERCDRAERKIKNALRETSVHILEVQDDHAPLFEHGDDIDRFFEVLRLEDLYLTGEMPANT